MNRRVTLKMVAERAGVHFSTVSLGLRNDPRIPARTCQRIQKVAQEMGYVPDPMMRALCTYREKGRNLGVHSGMAYLTDLPPDLPFNKVLFQNAREEAESLGYSLNEFNLNHPGSSIRHFFRVWPNTGIKGVLIGPFSQPATHLDQDWSKWITVAFGYSVQHPNFNRVVHDQYHNMLGHLLHLREAYGYQRIGLMISNNLMGRTDGLHYAAYLLDRSRIGIPPVAWDTDHRSDPVAIREWILKENLEMVIGDESHFELIKQTGLPIPDKIGFSLFEWRNYTSQRPPDCAGFNPRTGWAARRAVSFLASQINEQSYGIPEVPVLLLVAGKFQAGRTLRPPLASKTTHPESTSR